MIGNHVILQNLRYAAELYRVAQNNLVLTPYFQRRIFILDGKCLSLRFIFLQKFFHTVSRVTRSAKIDPNHPFSPDPDRSTVSIRFQHITNPRPYPEGIKKRSA